MKFRFAILILISILFLSGYKYEYYVPPLNAVNNAVKRNNQGIMYMEMGQYIPAISEFKIAISLSPNSPASAAYYNNLGLAYIKCNALDLAKPCFEKAINLNPIFLEYYQNQLNLYAKTGELNSLLSANLNKIKANKNNSQAYFMTGLIYKKQGKKKQAVNCFKKYIVLENENVMSRAAKQMIYEMMTGN